MLWIRNFIFSFFANQNFSWDRKDELLHKWIALILQVKFHFMGCLIKVNALCQETDSIVIIITVNTIIVFMKQPTAERHLANIFSQVFLWFFRKFLQCIKKRKHSENFYKADKKQPWRSLIWVKLLAFTDAATRGVL